MSPQSFSWPALIGVGVLVSGIVLAAAPEDYAGARRAAGERLYLTGVSVSGKSMPTIVQGDLRVRSNELPCWNCHKRSGWGTSEGPLTTPPVVGPVLFQPVTRGAAQIGARTTGLGTRPAYTEQSLVRALRDGIDPAGRVLSATMPRYEVREEDVAALGEYLKSLSSEQPPGVTESALHLATIVGPGVSDGRRDSMLDVLRAFVRAKNGGTRYESRRRERGPWDMKEQYDVYRTWVLHEWKLRGDPKDWTAQLEELYREQPVFAIVGGLVDSDWSPIHEFCVRRKLPAVLPQAPLAPATANKEFYGLYYSRGVTGDAEKLAHHLEERATPQRVIQVARCDSPGHVAASAFEEAASSGMGVETGCFGLTETGRPERWRTLLAKDATALVLWLDHADRAAIDLLASEPSLLGRFGEVFLSSALLGESAFRLPSSLAGRVSLIHPFAPPETFERHAWRTLAWFRANKIAPEDRFVAMNAFFAVTVTSDALGMPRSIQSRELFVERLEHMIGPSPHRSAYASLSVNALHRYASAAFRIVKAPAENGGSPTKVEE